MWDAGQYLRFGDERSRPFFDLLSQVRATDPGYVADLGCGPGNLTAVLARRWPGAEVVGVDNSAAMITAATESALPGGQVSFKLGDVREWQPGSADSAAAVIIAAELSTPTTSAPGHRRASTAVRLPGPQPRSATYPGSVTRTCDRRSKNGRERSSPNRRYCPASHILDIPSLMSRPYVPDQAS